MESNHVIPRYQRGAVTVWLTPLHVVVVSGAIEAPPAGFNRPLRRQSFETVMSKSPPENPVTGAVSRLG